MFSRSALNCLHFADQAQSIYPGLSPFCTSGSADRLKHFDTLYLAQSRSAQRFHQFVHGQGGPAADLLHFAEKAQPICPVPRAACKTCRADLLGTRSILYNSLRRSDQHFRYVVDWPGTLCPALAPIGNMRRSSLPWTFTILQKTSVGSFQHLLNVDRRALQIVPADPTLLSTCRDDLPS